MVSSAVYATALAQLDGLGPKRLARLLADATPHEAFVSVRRGHLPVQLGAREERSAWPAQLESIDLDRVENQLVENGVTVTTWHDSAHPRALVDDIDPAPVLFRRGAPVNPDAPAVAIVGTRRCTGTGRDVAYELGAALAAAGVVVVSGLALGIDGASHLGALSVDGVAPLAVVGSGPDVVYPRRHRVLWEQMVADATLCTEAPPGTAPARWRFPARNRLLTAFADIVVVVESRAAGGSLLTVDHAIRRGLQVMAVPGSTRNPAAEGTNSLLADGCAPVRNADDILCALGLAAVESGARRRSEPVLPIGEAAIVLAAMDDGPANADDLVGRTGLPARVVFAQLEILIGSKHLVADGARVRRA